MRPDEHKKKRSRQYQKKHGTAPNKTNTSDGKGKKETVQQTKNTPAVGSRGPQPKQSHQPTAKDISSSSDSDSEEQVRPQFQRRTIQSNWTRYDGEDLDSSTHVDYNQKAEDFQRLLNKVVTAESQMKLQDEKHWEDETLNAAIDAGFLAIDFTELSQAIKEVPLSERYGITEEAKQAGFLNFYEQQSKAAIKPTSSSSSLPTSNILPSHTKYPPSSKVKLTTKLTPEKLAQTTKILDNLSLISKDLKSAVSDSHEESAPPSDPIPELTEEERYARAFWTVEKENNVSESEVVTKETETESDVNCVKDTAVQDEDDLDDLLNLDKPVVSRTIITQPESPPVKVKNNCVNKVNTVSQVKEELSVSENKTEVADLEDWLDSVLDD